MGTRAVVRRSSSPREAAEALAWTRGRWHCRWPGLPPGASVRQVRPVAGVLRPLGIEEHEVPRRVGARPAPGRRRSCERRALLQVARAQLARACSVRVRSTSSASRCHGGVGEPQRRVAEVPISRMRRAWWRVRIRRRTSAFRRRLQAFQPVGPAGLERCNWLANTSSAMARRLGHGAAELQLTLSSSRLPKRQADATTLRTRSKLSSSSATGEVQLVVTGAQLAAVLQPAASLSSVNAASTL